jgi:hypothetical protein
MASDVGGLHYQRSWTESCPLKEDDKYDENTWTGGVFILSNQFKRISNIVEQLEQLGTCFRID